MNYEQLRNCQNTEYTRFYSQKRKNSDFQRRVEALDIGYSGSWPTDSTSRKHTAKLWF